MNRSREGAKEADLTLVEMRDRLAGQGVQIKVPALWHQLNKWGLCFKKTLPASEQEREGVQLAKRQWQARQPAMDASRLVFLDETCAATDMARLRAVLCGIGPAWTLESHDLHGYLRRSGPAV